MSDPRNHLPQVPAKATVAFLCLVLAVPALSALRTKILFASALVAQTTAPETPAGKVFTVWLTAFNSADAAQLRAFNETFPPAPPPVEGTLDFREQTGGFTLLRINLDPPAASRVVDFYALRMPVGP